MTEHDRITELEIRLAHQDKVIVELNEVITAQWKKLESLERQIRRLDEEVQAMDASEVPNQKPPHY
jgi:SlyX protein